MRFFLWSISKNRLIFNKFIFLLSFLIANIALYGCGSGANDGRYYDTKLANLNQNLNESQNETHNKRQYQNDEFDHHFDYSGISKLYKVNLLYDVDDKKSQINQKYQNNQIKNFEYLVALKHNYNHLSGLNALESDSDYQLNSANFYHKKNIDYSTYYRYSKDININFLTSFSITNSYPSQQSLYLKHNSIKNYALSTADDKQFNPLANLVLMSFNSHAHAKKVLSNLLRDNKIWFAEPNYQNYKLFQDSNTDGINDSSVSDNSSQNNNRDPFYDILKYDTYKKIEITAALYELYKNNYYHIDAIKLDKALYHIANNKESSRLKSVLQGDKVIIAVMDSGIDIKHPGLKYQIVSIENSGFLSSSVCENDINGCNTSTYIDKGVLGTGNIYPVGTKGFNQSCQSSASDGFAAENSQPNDEKFSIYCRHGTHIAGIVAGFGPGIFGICPFCQILPVRVVDDNYKIPDSSIIRGLEYISLFQTKDNRRVSIVNSSFGKHKKSLSVAYLIKRLAINNGILFVAAAGNEFTMQREYPSALDDVIAVAAVDYTNKKIYRSNFGGWIDIAAPGQQIESSAPGERNFADTGTSVAAPMVSGVAGLILSVADRNLSASELRHILEFSSDADKLYAVNPDHKIEKIGNYYKEGSLGFGILDAHAAVTSDLINDPSLVKKRYAIKGCSSIGLSVYIDSDYFDHQGLYVNSNSNFDILDVLLVLMMLILPGVCFFVGRRSRVGERKYFNV